MFGERMQIDAPVAQPAEIRRGILIHQADQAVAAKSEFEADGFRGAERGP